MTLGDLTVAHLGRVVSWQDGGATFTGVLLRVQHDYRDWGSPARSRVTHVGVRAGGWRHAGTYASDTRCAVSEAPKSPDAFTAPVTAIQAGQGA